MSEQPKHDGYASYEAFLADVVIQVDAAKQSWDEFYQEILQQPISTRNQKTRLHEAYVRGFMAGQIQNWDDQKRIQKLVKKRKKS